MTVEVEAWIMCVVVIGCLSLGMAAGFILGHLWREGN